MTDISFNASAASVPAEAITVAQLGVTIEESSVTPGKWNRGIATAPATGYTAKWYIGTNPLGDFSLSAAFPTAGTTADTVGVYKLGQTAVTYLTRDATGETEEVNHGPQYVEPALSSQSASATGPGSATATATPFSAPGTIYAYAVTSGTPDAAAIKAGAQGSTAVVADDADSAVDVSMTGLTANTTYTVYMMQEAPDGQQSPVVATGSITTSASATAPVPFTATNWALLQAYSSGGDTLTVTIDLMPNDGGDPVTLIEWTDDGGSSTNSLALTSTGSENITVTADTEADIQLRSTNSTGTSDWGDVQTATPQRSSGTLQITGTATVGSIINIDTPDPTEPHFLEAQIIGKSEWIALTAADPLGGFAIPPQAAGCYLRVGQVALDGNGQPNGVTYSSSFGPVGLSLDTPDITVSSVSALNTAIANTGYSVIQVDGGTYDGSAVTLIDRSANPLVIQSDPTDPAIFTGTMNVSNMRGTTLLGHTWTGSWDSTTGNMSQADCVWKSVRVIGPDLTPAQIKSDTLIDALYDGQWLSCEELGNCTFEGLMLYNVQTCNINQWSHVKDVSWKYVPFDGFRVVGKNGNTGSHQYIQERVFFQGITGKYNELGSSSPHVDATQIFDPGGSTAPTESLKAPVLRNTVHMYGNTRAEGWGDGPILQGSAARIDDTIIDGCMDWSIQSFINYATINTGLVLRRCSSKRSGSSGGAVRLGGSLSVKTGFFSDRSSYPSESITKDAKAYNIKRDSDNAVDSNFTTNYRGPDTKQDVDDWMEWLVQNAPKSGGDADGRGALTTSGHLIMLDDLQDAPAYSDSSTSSSITVTIADTAGAEYYLMRWRQGSSGAWTLEERPTRAVAVIGLSSATEYQFQVCVSTAAAGISRWSAIDSVTTS